jgi:hypothetical protein
MKLFRPRFEQDPRWQRDNWAALPRKESQTYKAGLALRAIIADLAKEAVGRLAIITTPPGTADTIANLGSEVRRKVFEAGKELASAKILLEAIEVSAEFKFAEQEFAPLLLAAAERDKADDRLRESRQQAEAALSQARESAWRLALEKAEESPDILKATATLAAAKEAEAAVSEL